MIGTPITGYVSLGSALRYLQDAKAGWLIRGTDLITGNIDSVESKLKAFDLLRRHR